MDNIQASELAEGVWRRVALGHGLKLLTKNGHVYKYDGFRESVRAHAQTRLAALRLLAPAWPVPSPVSPQGLPRLPRDSTDHP